MRNIYENRLINIKNLGYINGELGVLRNSLTKVIDRSYNQDEVSIIRENDKYIRENFKQMDSLKKDVSEEEILKKMKSNYEEYMRGAEEIINKRKEGQSIETSYAQEYGKFGGNVSKIIKESMDYNKQI